MYVRCFDGVIGSSAKFEVRRALCNLVMPSSISKRTRSAVQGQPVQLTQLEIDLLKYFSLHPGRVLGRNELLEKVWKLRNYSNTRTVDNFISRLRRRFEVDAAQPAHFVSVRGAGYKFIP